MKRAAALCLPLLALAVPAADADVAFSFPGAEEHRQHFYVTAYRDLTGSGAGIQDWSCGSHAYDGHGGTDIGGGSFAGMDEGRDIVAAASGVVTQVFDGAFDRCTSGDCAGGGGFGNYVAIEHEDGKVTYYGHLKKYSITVAVGDRVSCGQKVGQMGSSGRSTGPHLHFEPRVNNVGDDPFTGSCGGPISWWQDQGTYRDLPLNTCEDSGAGSDHPVLTMDASVSGLPGAAANAEQSADDVVELSVGDEVEARYYVTADDAASVARDVVLGIDAPGDQVTILGWEIFDDYPGNACGGEMCPNDANEHPDNPSRERPGENFALHLYALSPGETKMIVLTLRADAASGERPVPVQAWIKEIPGTYEKPDVSAEPVNIDDSQTFNGGDLKQAVELAIRAPAGGGGDEGGDDGDDGDGGDDDPGVEPTNAGGGCTAAGEGAPGPVGLVLPLLALLALRLRRQRPLPQRR